MRYVNEGKKSRNPFYHTCALYIHTQKLQFSKHIHRCTKTCQLSSMFNSCSKGVEKQLTFSVLCFSVRGMRPSNSVYALSLLSTKVNNLMI